MVTSTVNCWKYGTISAASFPGAPPLLALKVHKWRDLCSDFFLKNQLNQSRGTPQNAKMSENTLFFS